MISSHNLQPSDYSEHVVISYSQNQEDVILHRLVEFVSKGTYVDVGAGHPIYDNVTYTLYQAGWRGINIEPMKREADWLKEIRPGDRTYEIAVGSTSGRLTLFAAPDENRGATTADEDLVRGYQDRGQEFHPFEVDVVRLDSLLEVNNLETIHILKIDVEGAERQVLEGASLSQFRPWVIVVEATRPNSTEDVSSNWEDLILSSGYIKTLFDGLNNFYVRGDLPEIASVLSTPSNVFDGWKSFELMEVTRQARELEVVIHEMTTNFERELLSRDEAHRAAEEYVASLITRAEHAENYAKQLQIQLGLNKSQ